MKELTFCKLSDLQPTTLAKNELFHSFFGGFSLLFNSLPRSTYFKEHISMAASGLLLLLICLIRTKEKEFQLNKRLVN